MIATAITRHTASLSVTTVRPQLHLRWTVQTDPRGVAVLAARWSTDVAPQHAVPFDTRVAA